MMFKRSIQTMFICAMLAAQCPAINAGVPPSLGIEPAGVAVLIGGFAATGAIGAIALMKASQWARREQGAKKFAGYSFLGATGIGALVGFGYLMGYTSKR